MSRIPGSRRREDRAGRIISTLLALADLIEQASFQTPYIRFFLLWLLRAAEAVARRHAINLAEDADMPDLPYQMGLFEPIDGADSAAQALAMAMRLRIIAAILAYLAGRHRALDCGTYARLRQYFRRHMAHLTQSAQQQSCLRWRAMRIGHSALRRPEVRLAAPPCRD